MPKLYRIIGAAIKETETLKIVEKLGQYSNNVLGKIPSKEVSIFNKEVTMGGRLARDIEIGLKSGRVDELKYIYKYDGNISPQIQQVLKQEVENLPSYKLAQVDNKVTNMSKSIDNEKFISKTADDLTDADVTNSKQMSGIVEYLKNKSFVSLSAGTVLIGGSVTAIVLYINRHRKAMSGCFKYEIKTKTMTACKIIKCSCLDGKINTEQSNIMVCSSIPESMKNGDCGKTTGYDCVNCPPKSIDDEIRGDLAIDNTLDIDDNVFYKCNKPSILDAISDLVGDKIDSIESIVGDTVDNVTGLFTTIINVLKYASIVGGVVFCAMLLFYLYQKFFNKKNETIEYKPLLDDDL